MSDPIWVPDQARIEQANVTRFAREAIGRRNLGFNNYPDFYRWTVKQPEQFWQSVWSFCGVIASDRGDRVVADREKMPGARWFPDAKLNFAENLLRRRDESVALLVWGEAKVRRKGDARGTLRTHLAHRRGAARIRGQEGGPRVTCRTCPRPPRPCSPPRA